MIEVFQSKNALVGSRIDVQGNVRIGDIIITNIFSSFDYQQLRDDIQEAEQDFNEATTDQMRLRKSAKLNELREKEESFKQDVLRLAETFSRITIDTERLRKVQEYIQQGNFREADAILKAEDLTDEQEQLLSAKQKALERLEDLDTKLRSNAEEFLLKAQLTAADYANPQRYELCTRYFEQSVKSFHYYSNLSEFANFLEVHHQLSDSELYWQFALNHANDEASKARTLHAIAGLQLRAYKIVEAKENYQKALKIRRQLASLDPDKYLSDLSDTLNDIGWSSGYESHEFQQTTNDDYSTYYYQALEIRRGLASTNPDLFLPSVAQTLNNLAGYQELHLKDTTNAEKNYLEAINIMRSLVVNNPEYLGSLALKLNNFAQFQGRKGTFEKAEELFQEALSILRPLAKQNPQEHLPLLGLVLKRFADVQYSIGRYKSAEKNCQEALLICKELLVKESVEYVISYCSALKSMALIQQKNFKRMEAKRNFRESININRTLISQDHIKFSLSLAHSLTDLANLENEMQEYKESEKNYEEAVKIFGELSDKYPGRFLISFVVALNTLAEFQRDIQKYANAIQNYRKQLKIYELLVIKDPLFLFELSRTYFNLARLQEKSSRFEEVEKIYLKSIESIQIYQGLDMEKQTQCEAFVAYISLFLGEFQYKNKKYPKATKSYQKALELYRALAKQDQQTFLPSVISSLNLIAVLLQQINRHDESQAMLQEANEIRLKLEEFNKQQDSQDLSFLRRLPTVSLPDGIAERYKHSTFSREEIYNDEERDEQLYGSVQ